MEHPLAAAIVASVRDQSLTLETPANFQSVTGQDVRGTVGGRRVALGNAKLMQADGVDISTLAESAERLCATGATALFAAVDGRPGGVIAVADPIKETTLAALETLRADGVRIVMLTGDNRRTAEAIASHTSRRDC